MRGKGPPSLLGVGLYSIPRAAQLVGVAAPTLKRWARGYTYRTEERRRYMDPVLRAALPALVEAGTITFLDLMELLFVAEFRRHNVSMPVIRAAARKARELFGVSHPFAVKRLCTDGRSILADLEPRDIEGAIGRDRLLHEIHTGQNVIRDIVEPFIVRSVELVGDEIGRYWPDGFERQIVLDPDRRFGDPVHAGTGIPTSALYDCAKAYQSLADVARWYDIHEDVVTVSVGFEESLRHNHRLAAA